MVATEWAQPTGYLKRSQCTGGIPRQGSFSKITGNISRQLKAERYMPEHSRQLKAEWHMPEQTQPGGRAAGTGGPDRVHGVSDHDLDCYSEQE